MSRDITVVLQRNHARRFVKDLASKYARLWLQDVATVRQVPSLSQEERDRLRDYRAALESIVGVGMIPRVPEPEYPARFLPSDHQVVKKTRVVVPGLMAYDRVDQSKLRKGATKRPTWSSSIAAEAAISWADRIVAQLLAPSDERDALADEATERTRDALPDGAGGGS